MDDINQMHGSTQTNEFLDSREYEDEIATKIGIKDFFPKKKKILAHKNQKNQLEPLEILTKFRKKVFGISEYQKKLTFKAKKNPKKVKSDKDISQWGLEVKKISPEQRSEKSLFSGTHLFFPKLNGSVADKDKKTFMTDIDKSNSKNKTQKLFFNKPREEVPDNDTVYSSYVLRDFASPNKNEFDLNLNYNTFQALFKREKKFLKDKKFDAKNIAEFEKEKKLINKVERRIQTEFLQKISFPPNEKFMNKTINNFNFNKGLYKINDLRGSVTSADKISNLVASPDQAPRSSLSSSNKLIREFSSLNTINSKQISNKNFNRTRFNFNGGPKPSSEKFNFTAQNFHRKSNIDLNNFSYNFKNNQNKNFKDELNLRRKSFSPERREKRGKTSEAQFRHGEHYTQNKNVCTDFEKVYTNKFGTEGDEEEELLSFGSKNNRNPLAHKGLFSGGRSPKKEFKTHDLSNNLEKKHYTFNLNQSSNAHVLHMLRINQKHDKLGLTKRIKLGPNNGLNEKILREKLKSNLDRIVKRQQNDSNANYNSNYRNEFGKSNINNNKNNSERITFNITFNTFNPEKSKFLKINKNLFNNRDIPNEERKYYEIKKDKEYTPENKIRNFTENNNNFKGNNNIQRVSDLNNIESQNLENYMINLDEEKSNFNNNTNLNESSTNNNNNISDKIEALNEEYENKTDLSIKNKTINKNNEGNLQGGKNKEYRDANVGNEGISLEEKTRIIKNKTKENNDFLSSPQASMDQIISKKTFEKIDEKFKIKDAGNLVKNDEIGNVSKRNMVLNGKRCSKNGTLSLIKNQNLNNIKTGRGTKTTLLHRQANNQDISGLQI